MCIASYGRRLTASNLLGAYFLIRAIQLITLDWRVTLAAVVVYLVHPALAVLRLYPLADQLAIGLMAGSLFLRCDG